MTSAELEVVKKKTKQVNAKKEKGNIDQVLYGFFSTSLSDFRDYIKVYSIYQMGQWILGIQKWISNFSTNNTNKYKRGSIILVDLGCQNFKYEPSYSHPCIVLHEKKDKILIVSCSSKEYGLGYPNILDATKNDGFNNNTGIQIDNFRWVHKNRIVGSVLGTVASGILDKIDERILKYIPTYKKKIANLNSEIALLKKEVEVLKK